VKNAGKYQISDLVQPLNLTFINIKGVIHGPKLKSMPLPYYPVMHHPIPNIKRVSVDNNIR